MRKPATIEYLYLDFDGFFASVEQQARPALRGLPVGIVPFSGTEHTCVIACSREAKEQGVRNVMNVTDARRICPELVLVPQSPDLYRRAHNTLIAEINAVIPVEAIKSIDELTCRLSPDHAAAPDALAARLKARLAEHVGRHITASIGFAANRQLAKIACKMNKPDGVTIWHPDQVPGVLLPLPFEEVPGIGHRMAGRLMRMGVVDMTSLMALPPKQWRAIWRGVTGERLWYALNGYAIKAERPRRGMFGHGRVLPPEARSPGEAYRIARMLLIKAARRMRRERYSAGRLWLWAGLRDTSFGESITLPAVSDDKAVLDGLSALWARMRASLPGTARIIRIGVTLGDLAHADKRQLDLLLDDDRDRRKWEVVSRTVDGLNRKHAKSVVTLGPWTPPKGGHLGGKISYTRIPRAEDFW